MTPHKGALFDPWKEALDVYPNDGTALMVGAWFWGPATLIEAPTPFYVRPDVGREGLPYSSSDPYDGRDPLGLFSGLVFDSVDVVTDPSLIEYETVHHNLTTAWYGDAADEARAAFDAAVAGGASVSSALADYAAKIPDGTKWSHARTRAASLQWMHAKNETDASLVLNAGGQWLDDWAADRGMSTAAARALLRASAGLGALKRMVHPKLVTKPPKLAMSGGKYKLVARLPIPRPTVARKSGDDTTGDVHSTSAAVKIGGLAVVAGGVGAAVAPSGWRAAAGIAGALVAGGIAYAVLRPGLHFTSEK